MKKTIILVLILALSLAAEDTNADFTFDTPTNLEHNKNVSDIFVDSLSADGLEMYVTQDIAGGYGGYDIWVSKRPTTGDDWGALENLGSPVNTSEWDHYPYRSHDGLELYFVRGVDGDIWLTTRATTDDDWGNPVKLGPEINTPGREDSPSISPDGLELYFNVRNRAGGHGSDDIWVAKRATKNDPWGSPVNLGPVVNTSASEAHPSLSADGLLLFFSENLNQPQRPGGYGNTDSWVTRRASISEPWGTPVNLGPIVNTAGVDGVPRMSPDGLTLYFNSNRPGGNGGIWGDSYQARIIPIVDLNADGIVNSADMCIMVDYWGTDEPLCDIGPTPFGDGIVDVQDLMILSEYLFEDINDPTLVAHWALNEEEGDFAQDDAGDNIGIVVGDPVWQPASGQVDGALQLDGIDDVVIARAVLNPADGPFSVLAWIRGGAAGQAVISQQGGSNWLGIDPLNGCLMTELVSPPIGRFISQPLESNYIITDDIWHHVGFVWDGSYRTLYVDGTEVTKDASPLTSLKNSNGSLYIGCGKGMESGSFFSGLIDDIRIYNRAVSP